MCIMSDIHTHPFTVRTNIDLDDALMREAQELTGLRTKRETVEHALKTLVRLARQEKIRALRGRIAWEGDLEAMRRDG